MGETETLMEGLNDYLEEKFPGVKGTTEPAPATGVGEFSSEEMGRYLNEKFPKSEKP